MSRETPGPLFRTGRNVKPAGTEHEARGPAVHRTPWGTQGTAVGPGVPPLDWQVGPFHSKPEARCQGFQGCLMPGARATDKEGLPGNLG